MKPVLERVTFRTFPNTDPENFKAASASVSNWARQRDGFLSRNVVEENGTYTDFVIWATMEDAKAAGEAFMGASETAAMAALIDPESVKMEHLPITSSSFAA